MVTVIGFCCCLIFANAVIPKTFMINIAKFVKSKKIKAMTEQQPIPQDINMNDRNIQKLEHILKQCQSEVEQQKETIEELKKQLNAESDYQALQAAEIESLKQENERRLHLLDLAQAELRAMYGRYGFHGSNVLDLIDKEIDEPLKQQTHG